MYKRQTEPAAREQALKHMAAFGLAGYENAYPGDLSGGMRQRAAFLRTALCSAEILLPVSYTHLDVYKRQFQAIFPALALSKSGIAGRS